MRYLDIKPVWTSPPCKRVRDVLSDQTTLRVLSVRQYPALALAALDKDHENRTWMHGLPDNEWVAIHAGSAKGSPEHTERALRELRPETADAELEALRAAVQGGALAGRIVALVRFGTPVPVDRARGWRVVAPGKGQPVAWPVLQARAVLGGPRRGGALGLRPIEPETLTSLLDCALLPPSGGDRRSRANLLRRLVQAAGVSADPPRSAVLEGA